ncbi:hypothetical protein NKG95_31755 [Mesorhizobium sp. M1423]|uniref:hypothetical protein n=1 Tax=Mesorhizobium sp. M1423 TaxID=2957101 RepID=UPI003337D28A
MAVQDRTARPDVDGVFWLGLPVGSMMDNTDIKAREAKIGELKGNMDAINAARRKGGCVDRHFVSRSNVKIVRLLPALATAEWSFNRSTRNGPAVNLPARAKRGAMKLGANDDCPKRRLSNQQSRLRHSCHA